VGGDAAVFSALKMLDREILLLDVVDGLPQGEAMDINHMLSERGVDVTIRGSNDYSDMEGSDVVVVVAGSGRKPGMTRMDLLKINAGIVKSVVSSIAKFAPDSIIIPVTNPLDPMVYITHKVSGFERNRVFGMGGMLDASRFRQFIHEATGHSRNSIRAMVIGEHGEHMLPLTRYSSVSGIPLCSFVPQPQLDAMVKNTREVALKVIQTKGATVHAPGNAIASMIEAVVKDQKQLIPVSTYLDGEYGYHDLVLGVPAVIGRRGVESIMDLDLNDSERRTMDAAAESVRTAIASLDI
jgi:malate dehydrogenase